MLCSLLVACGGNDNDVPTTPVVTAEPTQSGSKLQASFDPQASMLTLEWDDIMTDELGYRVEQKTESAVSAVTSIWNTVEDLPAYSGQGQKITWKKPITSQGEYRVIVKLPTQNKVLLTASGVQALTVSPALQAAIILSTSEPLRNSVSLSVQATGFTPKSVTYYSDLFKLGSSNVSTNFAFNWDVSKQTDGIHQLLAQVEVSPNSYLLVRKQVQIDNPNLAMTAINVSLLSNNLHIIAQATSETGVKKLQLFIDGQARELLTSMNGCSSPSNACFQTPFNAYVWDVSLSSLVFGTHQIKVIAEDNNGELLEKMTTYFKNDDPQVTLLQPQDGQIINQNLQISGSVTDDEDNPLVTIKLRDLEIYRGVGKLFFANYDMSSLPFGSYTLTLIVKPTTGLSITKNVTVNYQSSASVIPEYLTTLGTVAQVQDVNQNNILQSDESNIFLYDSLSQQKQLVIAKNAIDYLRVTQLVGKRVLMYGQDKVSKQYQIYLWDNGTLKNLSELSGENEFGPYTQEHPMMQGSWVVWSASGLLRYRLYNVDTQETHSIPKPSYSPYTGNWNYGLVVLPDSVRFYTWTQTGGSGTQSRFDILQYDSKTKATTRLTDNGLVNIYTQANQSRVAWQQTTSAQGNNPPYSLVVAPISNPLNQQVLSTVMKQFWLSKNWLVWEEIIGNQTVIQANNEIGEYSLPAALVQVIAVGVDYVIYNKGSSVWAWKPTEQPYQLFAFPINQARFDEATGLLYFTTGAENSLYRVSLP